ncbi:MAG TPA: nucleotidyl transferase AbiEii/AbiGii toxin family protein [Gemmatimonadales bacterium]|nr:nucleotidyl transferase AbiEii/AbiGii toxin family protein [Gemmatimonadales bacterium]
MTAPGSRLATVCGLLNAAGVKYVVVGGFALALHGVVRATKDIDVLIEPTAANAQRTLKALEGLTSGIARELDPSEIATRPITIVGDEPRVDILTLAWSVRYADAAPKAERIAIDGVDIPFADLDTLIRTKQTGRFQDNADVESLELVKRLKHSSL